MDYVIKCSSRTRKTIPGCGLDDDFVKNKEFKPLWENLHLVTQLGLTMVGCILFCFAIGYFIDKWLGIKAVFSIIFLLLGIGGGGYTAYRQIQEVFTDKDQKDRQDFGKK